MTCRFRTFIVSFAQTTSAWLLACVALDRLIRASTPHHARRWCTKKHALIALVFVVVCSVTLNSHVLQPLFTTLSPLNRVLCGPSLTVITNYSIFYNSTWPPLQICVNILVPASLMIACLIGIYRKVRTQAVVRQNRNLQTQMLVLMLSKTILFMVCTLPYGVFRMATIYLPASIITAEFTFFLTTTAVLTILLDSNYSTAFYIHCLTSTLFRQTFIKTIRECIGWRRRRATIRPVIDVTATMKRTT